MSPSVNLYFRGECGSQMSSLFCGGIRGTVIACWRQYLRIPFAPPQRVPMPESFQPPIGRAKLNMLEPKSLMLTAPTSS